MKETGFQILNNFKKRRQAARVTQIFLYATGPAILTHVLLENWAISVAVFLLVLLIAVLILRPWKLNLPSVAASLDDQLRDLEFSTGLLLLSDRELTPIAAIQKERVSEKLKIQIRNAQGAEPWYRPAVLFGAFLFLSFLVFYFNWFKLEIPSQESPKNQINFRAMDSLPASYRPPSLSFQEVTIRYPSYTGKPTETNSAMNIKALEGSQLTWKIKFDQAVHQVDMESFEHAYPMEKESEFYVRSSILSASGFYGFAFRDQQGNAYKSDLYSIELIQDGAPKIEVPDLAQFSSFEFEADKQLNFKVFIQDDYGISESHIIATVSKGSGESVKFREEKLAFDTPIPLQTNSFQLDKKIDLAHLKMDPGDELYFYIEAIDNKRPVPNISRSETFFAIIKDTLSEDFAVEGTLGVDLMPDYFRSQRQLIIDTEKLLKDRSKISKPVFNARSNELGFDQKALRIKYGEFMGDENEGSVAPDHEEEGDPLAEFTHDHDGENEHNLVEQEHDHEEETTAQPEDPLHDYLHNHDHPEASTLFTQSIKSKLKQAMQEMWDAELYLRLFEPQKSLPFQYKALKLIQEIKNSARIYVHRIGFDPPPIKEDARLGGDLEFIRNYGKTEELTQSEINPAIKEAVLRLEVLKSDNAFTPGDPELFQKAGAEVAEKANLHPGKYLGTLQELQALIESKSPDPKRIETVQRGLFQILENEPSEPGRTPETFRAIDQILIQELEKDDR